MGGTVLVVARYKEDVSWLDKLGFEHLVVQKGDQLPNKGREASSFFWGMQHLYDAEYDRLAFLQGNPFEHGMLNLGSSNDFRWIGEPKYLSYENGAPWHPGLPVKEKFLSWFGKWGVKWPGCVQFAAGGQFSISKERLHRYQPEFYENMQQEMYEGQNPWVMERLWGMMFQ